MKPSEILRAAKERIATPATWCQEVYAKDKWGLQTAEIGPDAAQWCALGAMHITKQTHHSDIKSTDYAKAMEYLLRVMRPECDSLARFNDNHTHAEVMTLFDTAIDYALRKETPP